MNAELKTFVDSLGLEYKATFVPQSHSRNANEEHKSLNWRVSIRSQRGAGNTITTNYMQGIGHIPNYLHAGYSETLERREWRELQEKAAETGKYPVGAVRLYSVIGPKLLPVPPPTLVDVLHCLVLDGEAYDYSFEEWAREYAYDTDRRKALATWEACRDHGLKLRRMLSAEQLEKLRELFQDY